MSSATEGPTSDLKALEAAIGKVASTPIQGLRPEQLTERALVMERLRTRLESSCLATLREVDASGSWAATDPGAVNPKCWLANHTGQSRRGAGSRLNLARHLDRMPRTASALAAGEITESHARTLAWCAGPRTAALFAEHEARLIELARTHTADELAVLVRYWLQAADPDGLKPRDGRGDELFLSKTLDQWVLKGSLGEHLGAELAAALNDKCDQLFRQEQRLAETDPDDPTVGRSAAARRAAALAELVGLGAAAPESTIQRRPSITVHLDHDTFNALMTRHENAGGGWHGRGPLFPVDGAEGWDPAEHLCETDDGTVVSPELVRLLMCDADICRAVIGAGGEILNLGRSARTASAAQRKALIARDRGCVVPGCDRPPSWTDAHHISWWNDGGPTDISNLALVCRRHHTRIHQGHLRIRMEDGCPVVTNSAGTPLHHPRRPPPQPPPREGPGDHEGPAPPIDLTYLHQLLSDPKGEPAPDGWTIIRARAA